MYTVAYATIDNPIKIVAALCRWAFHKEVIPENRWLSTSEGIPRNVISASKPMLMIRILMLCIMHTTKKY
jgi:hypothetical protein